MPWYALANILKVLESLLPPKKPELEPQPDVVDEVDYEESDIVDVRGRSSAGGPDFLERGFATQFGDNEDDWEDEDEEDVYGDEMGGRPDCQHQ